MKNHSNGNWKIGNNWGVVVTDNGEGFPTNSGHDAVEYYGGYLIAESIAKEADAKLIAAAPDLLEALQSALRIKDLWSADQYGTNGADKEGEIDALKLMEDSFNYAIKKATE